MNKNNKVGDKIFSERGSWSFNKIKINNFENHINKSIPGYLESHNYIEFLSEYFITDNSLIYDIGCSTGNLIKKISNYNKSKKNIKFIGVEPVEKFRLLFNKNIKKLSKDHKFNFIRSDIQNIKLKKCDLVIMFYTLQFIKPEFRQNIINMIYDKLNWGGGLFLFEKVRGADSRFHDMINYSYIEYKKKVGYTNDEIINKMLSLKGILEPNTSKANHLFLKKSGFKDVSIIYKNLCFEGILAIK